MRVLPHGTFWWRIVIIGFWLLGGLEVASPLFVAFAVLLGGTTLLSFMDDRKAIAEIYHSWMPVSDLEEVLTPLGSDVVIAGPQAGTDCVGASISGALPSLNWRVQANKERVEFVLSPAHLGPIRMDALLCWLQGTSGLFLFGLRKSVKSTKIVSLPSRTLNRFAASTVTPGPEFVLREYCPGEPRSRLHARSSQRLDKDIISQWMSTARETSSLVCGRVEDWSVLTAPQVDSLADDLQRCLEEGSTIWLVGYAGGGTIRAGDGWEAVQKLYVQLVNGDAPWKWEELPHNVRREVDADRWGNAGKVIPVE